MDNVGASQLYEPFLLQFHIVILIERLENVAVTTRINFTISFVWYHIVFHKKKQHIVKLGSRSNKYIIEFFFKRDQLYDLVGFVIMS